MPLRHADEILEQLPLQPAGVLHADGDAGQQRFEYARRSEIEARPDLAQILRHRIGALGAVHAKPGDVALRVVEIVVAYPCKRQVGKHIVALVQSVELDGVAGGPDRTGGLQHHAFRAAGRSGRIEHDAYVFAARRADRRFPAFCKGSVGGHAFGAGGLDVGKGMETRRRIAGQAARLVIDHIGQRRYFAGARPDLVDLLLILHHGEAHAGMVEHIGHLVGDGVRIDRHRNGAERLRRRESPVETRTVGADDRDPVALGEAQRLQPYCEFAHLIELLAPRPALPDAEVLVAHGRAVAQPLGIAQQVFRECVHAAGQGRRNHAHAPPVPPVRGVAAIMPAASRRATPSLG